MKTPHALPSSQLLAGVLSLCLVGAGPAAGQAGEPRTSAAPESSRAFQDAMAEVARLYDALEYEQALSAVTRAKRLARSEGERSASAVYEGLLQADLGRREKALASFREGLSLDPEATLPVKVSPKVVGDFEAVRRELQRARPALARSATSRPGEPVPPSPRAPAPAPEEEARAQDAPMRVAAAPSVLTPSAESSRPATPPGVDLKSDARRSPSHRLPSVALVLLGTGVVAGGVGSYFGLQSRSNVRAARDAELTQDANRSLEDARPQALVANILFGAAIAAAAGAVTTYVLGQGSVASEGTP
ncbi:tetratricopeptide repeat protein [Corallococcus sp. Z5C101001]|uniref:tetratricopeptide repeat protein n=1 Tax=Corallococcus sp. Z5C101001 TaxID=2596829 RepID=UPI002104A1D7|nr:tetratricopeptide repeat protein [Corallococcus sp. Z5C101001]